MSRNNDVNITISINGDTHNLRAAREDVNALGRSLNNTDTIANALRSSFGKIAASVASIGALAVGVKELAASGIEANRSFENLKIQLTGLIAANSSNVSMLGKTLDAHAKWNMSMKESEGILKKLNETNAKTKFTLEEITGAFNMFYATSAGQGSRNKAVQAMDSIALAAQAVGKNLSDLTPMMDSLATGTVVAASEMGSFMKIVGLTNEELKKASSEGKVYDHIIEKLAKYKELSAEAAKGYEVALGSLKNELTELTRELTKPMFDVLTSGIASFSNFVKENKATIIEWAGYIGETVKHLGLLAGAFVAVKGAGILWGGALSLLQGGLAAITGMLPIFTSSLTASLTAAAALQAGLATLNKAFATLLPVATIYLIYESIDAIKALNGNLEEGASKLNSVQKFIYNFLDAFATQLQIAQMKIYQFVNDLKILALKAKQFFAELDDNYNPFSDGGGAEKIKGQIRLLEEYNKGYQGLIEQYKKDSVKRYLGLDGFETREVDGQITVINKSAKEAKASVDELKDAVNSLPGAAGSDKAKEKFGKTQILKDLTDDLEEAKKLLADLKRENKDETLIKRAEKYIEDLETKIKNFSKSANVAVTDTGALKNALKDIAEVNFTDIEKKTQRVIDRYNEMLGLGVGRQKAREYLNSSLAQIANEHLAEIEKSEKETLEKQLALRSEYYTAIGDKENAWQIKKAELEKKYQNLIFEDGKKITKEQLDKLLKIEEKAFLTGSKIAKNSFKDIKNSWADTVSSMSKTVDDGFFNFFIGKTKSLKTALKDIGTNLMRDLISPYARVLSQGISGGFGALLGGGSNLASIASNLGLAKNDRGGWDGTIGGTTVELSSTGQILRGADALDKSTTSLLSSVSNLQSAYSLLTSGYTGFISSFTSTPALNAASWLSMHGYAGLGQGVYGFGTGVKGALTATQFSSAGTAPYMAGSAFGGAALGYGIGYLGDKLFKANTYASTGGALGGAAGGLIAGMKAGSSMGPWGAVIGAVAGALIGGAFGKKKATGSGISVLQDITAGDILSNQNIRSYVDMQKKGWFSKKSWTEMSDLDDASMREIGAQLRSMSRMASRAGALASLTLKTGKYSGESLANEGFAKAILRSMTGQAEQMWAEVTESGGKKRKGLLGKIGGVFEKAMKFSPSSIINRITKPLDDAVSKAMNKAGLGAIDNMARGMRDEFGKASDGNIFGLKSSRKIDDLLNLSRDETNKNQRLVDNPEFSRMWKDWEEQAKKANKKVIELMSESLGAIADSYKSLELLSVRNPIKQVEISMRQAFESFTDAAEALKLDIPKEMGSIADLSVERMAQAYRKAIASDFTKSNVDSLNGLVKAYEAAKKAQDEYTKALISFTKSIAQTQAGFFAAVGRDTNVLTLQNIYTKFRALAGSIEGDLGADEMSRVSKLGNTNDPRVWAEYFYRMSARELQEFLSTGNVEMRKQLLEAVTEYNNHRNQNGGRDVWLKSLTGLEEIVKQIKALDLAEQARKTLEAQKQQLAVLNLQKSAVEKLASMAGKIRENVIDNQTAGINYALALQKAKAAFSAGQYDAKAYDELNSAISKQEQNLRDNAATYQDYRYEMLKLANEVEGISGDVNLSDLLEQIKKLDKLLNSANDTYSQQLDALKKQKEALELDSQNQIHALHDLLGKDSPVVAYLQAVRDAIIAGKAAPEYKGAPPANIANGAITANGAIISSSLDRDINEIYKDVLGRSVEQGGLDAWKRKAQIEGLSKEQLRAQIEATARAATGGNSKQDFIEWSKKRGYKPFADGGIVTRPTRALIGEAGYDEAVIPLDGRGIKVDMGGAFEALAKRLERVEQIAANIGRDVREMTMNARQTIENGAVNVRSIA
ncbi:hypothetical protein [uncultured Campylobacter sp.]|uniref:hypothetical protein n=1 Tax=uncultured Campylobacter sp. TaxID=218934 RepID=UPI0026018EB2|nr:hypothetical protein [uncultured Campylobacter sp.]